MTIVLVAATIIPWLFQLKWAGITVLPLAGIVSAIVVWAILYRLLFPDQIGLAEPEEGCVSQASLAADFAIFASLAAASIILAVQLWPTSA